MTGRVVVIGGGPVGIAAAWSCVARGLEVTVLERDTVGASLRRWGSTRFFTPLSMNLPAAALRLLGADAPPGEALLTGPQFVEQVLRPLATSGPLAGRVLEDHRVLSVRREGMSRGDYPGHPVRAEGAFEILCRTPVGERRFEAGAVLDASGTYPNPVPLGALGETAAASLTLRDLGALHTHRSKLANRTVMLVGSGHSAANAIVALEELVEEAPETRVHWLLRRGSLYPCTAVAGDPLPERKQIVSAANALARTPPPWLRVDRRATLGALELLPRGALRVAVRAPEAFVVDVDHLVALTGYRPDLSLSSELPTEISPPPKVPLA